MLALKLEGCLLDSLNVVPVIELILSDRLLQGLLHI
jgi:hypothetical protein